MYTEHNYNSSLYHHGIKGQQWGERRYQNSDGSYTPLGREHRARVEHQAVVVNKPSSSTPKMTNKIEKTTPTKLSNKLKDTAKSTETETKTTTPAASTPANGITKKKTGTKKKASTKKNSNADSVKALKELFKNAGLDLDNMDDEVFKDLLNEVKNRSNARKESKKAAETKPKTEPKKTTKPETPKKEEKKTTESDTDRKAKENLARIEHKPTVAKDVSKRPVSRDKSITSGTMTVSKGKSVSSIREYEARVNHKAKRY